jgi:hypothetical protein
MHRKPRVVVVENELLAGGRAVEPELAWRTTSARDQARSPCASDL